MVAKNFTGYKCWEDERISKVINKEAISIDQKEFLVTHTPFDEIRVLKSPENNKKTNEETFLAELLSRSHKNLHTFGVIQGVPGTGKSHLIRWLKERYAQKNANDEVILIERSNSTLKGVLSQIIASKAFSSEDMKDQFDQLQKAFGRLSEKTIGDEFLNNLLVSLETPIPNRGKQISSEVRTDIHDWLLDRNVRKWFMRKGGPVDRVRKHLAKDTNELGLREDEHPGILPSDLLIEGEDKANLEAAYATVRKFNERLADHPEFRKEIAAFLDAHVDFAIGRSVLLSSEDLKTIFFSLRSNLLQKNKNLALFIEDVTAFTGIDSGLVDVLVTQHTGEGNRTFCRVLSVIGITDSYYKDKFPDNLKSRIDIHLTLNSSEDSSAESSLLESQDVLVGMVARYLNAIRISDAELTDWFGLDADLSNIPIHCNSCPFTKECFESFGAAEVQMSRTGKKYKIGLYPFNEQAIQTMFSCLDSKVIKTPRSLLTSIVEYVLHNHGNKIPKKEFPPAPRDVGGEFGPPEMKEPLQRTALEDQAGPNKQRLLSLILFWGDKTIYAEDSSKGKSLGGLSEGVFQAFSLPMIAGQVAGKKLPPPKLPPHDQVQPKNPQVIADNTAHTNPPDQLYKDPDKYERYKKDISDWRDGNILRHYDVYAGWVAQFWRDSVQWADKGISQYQAQYRLTAGRFFFEGQAGEKMKSQIRFERSGPMADVLQALAQIEYLNVSLNKLKDSESGAIISVLSKWRVQYEHEVADFVDGVSEKIPAPVSIYGISVNNNMMLNTLGGSFNYADPDAIPIYENLISVACRKPDWSSVRNDKNHSERWKELCNQVPKEQIDLCRTNLLSLLNLPQGTSRPNVTFPNTGNAVYLLDAQKALYFIGEFSKKFQPEIIKPIPIVDDSIWNTELSLYLKLQDKFFVALQDEVRAINKEIEAIDKYLQDCDPQEIFDALRKVELAYFSVKQIYNGNQRKDLNGKQLKQLVDYFRSILKEKRTNYLALQLSVSSAKRGELIDYREYLQQEYETLQSTATHLQERIERSSSGLNKNEEQRVDKLYEELEQELENAIKNLVGGKGK